MHIYICMYIMTDRGFPRYFFPLWMFSARRRKVTPQVIQEKNKNSSIK